VVYGKAPLCSDEWEKDFVPAGALVIKLVRGEANVLRVENNVPSFLNEEHIYSSGVGPRPLMNALMPSMTLEKPLDSHDEP
jgi:hypothetical protein